MVSQQAAQDAPSFSGDDRYRVVRRIGMGAMGVVYEVEDRVRGERVALKTIRKPSSDLLYRLKREFRELADLRHPNLVRLHELVVDGGRSFFTMELIEGIDLLAYLRGTATPTTSPHDETISAGVTDSGGRPGTPPAAMPVEPAKVRPLMAGLASALGALHAAGKVHRDIKPSNVMVTTSGRVMVLDFGLVTATETPEGSLPGSVVGTVGYMAPEQSLGEERATPAADFYALGTILYEALTGQPPFQGALTQVLLAKQTATPQRAQALVPGVPDDLDDLCAALLQRNPLERPGLDDILAVLGTRSSAPALSVVRQGPVGGRDAELAILSGALRPLARGRPALVLLEGPSGIGKSALVRAFVERARLDDPQLLVLRGRCYERESVAYQAIDSLIDHLSATWLAMPPRQAATLLPLDAGLLPRLFPVLGRVPVVAEAQGGRAIADQQELRRRGFAALREVFVRLARLRPVVLVLDDLQWGDDSSLALIADLLGPPEPPALVAVLSTRPEGAARLKALSALVDAEVTTLTLTPLDAQAAETLALEMLGESATPELAQRIAAESAGSPFFIGELATLARGMSVEAFREVRLDDVLRQRIAALPTATRTVLEMVALAGEPMTVRVLRRAIDTDVRSDLEVLREARLVSSASGHDDDDRVEAFHDRVRDAVVAGLEREQRQRASRALAEALEALGEGSDELLAALWRGAGDEARAGQRARTAAEQALTRLDFGRAASLYRVAVEAGGWSVADRAALEVALGGALLDAGETRQAAGVLAKAAAASGGHAIALELKRRSAEALVRAGHIVEGMQTLREVLTSVGLASGRTVVGSIVRLLGLRLRLALRGLAFRERRADDLPARQLMRLDASWTAAACLLTTDFLRAAEHQSRHLLLALQAGEPLRVARGLVIEGAQLAVRGASDRGRSVLARVREILDRTPFPYVEAMYAIAQGMILMQRENAWRRALNQIRVAEEHYRRVTNATYELAGVRTTEAVCLLYLGELAELARRVPVLVRDAERREDQYTAGGLRLRLAIVPLMRDEPDQGVAEIERGLTEWSSPGGGYMVPNYNALVSLCEIALYQERPDRAAELLERDARPLKRAMLGRITLIRANLEYLRGRVALAQARASLLAGDRPAASQAAGRAAVAARRLRKVVAPVAPVWADLIDFGVAMLDGKPHLAAELLTGAVTELDRLEMRAFAACARLRLGQVVGGVEGAQLVAGAEAWLLGQGVREPAKLARVFVSEPPPKA